MADYKSMYYKLFNSVTDAIEILKKGQIEAEEMFINSEDDIKIFEIDKEQKEFSKSKKYVK